MVEFNHTSIIESDLFNTSLGHIYTIEAASGYYFGDFSDTVNITCNMDTLEWSEPPERISNGIYFQFVNCSFV